MIRLRQEQIEAWVARNFEYKRRSNGRQLIINNPFNADDGWHFWISTEVTAQKKPPHNRNYWVHDFRSSEYNTSFLSFVKNYKKCTFVEAVKDVTGISQKDIRKFIVSNNEKTEEKEEIQVSVSIPDSLSFENELKPFQNIALNYLISRGVSRDLAIELKLRCTPSTIVFPYIEYGEIVFWQERDIFNKRFNFPNQEKTGLSKTDFLYNFDNIEQPAGHVTVVESIHNCISVWDNCVASGGATLGGRQIQKLKALNPKLIILAPDNDQPDQFGKKAGLASLKSNFFLLRNDFKLAYTMPPNPFKDWNEMDQKLGIGKARRYVENNTYNLTLATVMKFAA